MPFEFGDVVLVPFPFTSQTASKKRPAVVVSSRLYNSAKPDVMLMAITSQLRASPEVGEVFLSGWQEAGLLKSSSVKPVIATLEQALVIRRLGALGSHDQNAVRRMITQILG